VDIGLPAVVSLTEHTDFEDEAELHELLPIALRCAHIDYIVVTKKWVDVEVGSCDVAGLKRLAALANVSLCLMSSHVTRLAKVKGASLCWDYTCGTPAAVPYVKHPSTGAKLPMKGFVYVGAHDWVARTKAARAVAPTAVWHEFCS